MHTQKTPLFAGFCADTWTNLDNVGHLCGPTIYHIYSEFPRRPYFRDNSVYSVTAKVTASKLRLAASYASSVGRRIPYSPA